jgi:uncharacterized phage-associated protein
MAYDARSIANYILELADTDSDSEPITHMKLQKLLYYAHGWYLSFHDSPLFTERIQAWKHGPVVPSVYRAFQNCGSSPITSHVPGVPVISPTDSNTKAFLSSVWQAYKRFSGVSLSSFTHQPGTPWSETVAPYKDFSELPHGLEISDVQIKEFFDAEANKRRGN